VECARQSLSVDGWIDQQAATPSIHSAPGSAASDRSIASGVRSPRRRFRISAPATTSTTPSHASGPGISSCTTTAISAAKTGVRLSNGTVAEIGDSRTDCTNITCETTLNARLIRPGTT
jgi:hypothetical protein